MKILALVGNRPNHLAFCQKLVAMHAVSSIVISENIVKNKKRSPFEKLNLLLNRVAFRLVGAELNQAWQEILNRYIASFNPLNVPSIIRVNNINEAQVLVEIHKVQPDLVLVMGTNLVSKHTIAAAAQYGKIMNLHTGISPYIKGGPNCTNWCLSENLLHLIGSTALWLDAGIDSGALIASERTPLNGSESLTELHWKVMEHAHDLYLRVIDKFISGKMLPILPQNEIGEGKTFYTREWNWRATLRAKQNYRKNFGTATFQSQNLWPEVKLFPLRD
jgi:folate-dependent phosphoribosylglycinamide formyltransferase PurN